MQKRAKENEISADWVLKKLRENLDRCMQTTPVLDKDGDEIGIYKWELRAANKALELIGKHIGMFIDRSKILKEVLIIGWTEYLNSPNPRPISTKIGKMLTKYLNKIL